MRDLPLPDADTAKLILYGVSETWKGLFWNELRQKNGSLNTFSPTEMISVETLPELVEAVRSFPASFVMVESDSQFFRKLVPLFLSLREKNPFLKIFVACFDLPQQTLSDAEMISQILLESGAVAVVSNQRELLEAIPVVIRHFSMFSRPEQDWRESVEQRLPWGNLTK
ncbi:MAG: hypothetical protein FWC50_10225 [Planctomycetaceae bacterium]|nr:hypothetical protein [Planctomycetaceae bacterium]